MLSALIPMPIDSGLNGREIRLGDGSFSDGQGQHSHYIAKRTQGRHRKMKKNEKNFGGGNLVRNLARFWVEMKMDGLKNDLFSLAWSC